MSPLRPSPESGYPPSSVLPGEWDLDEAPYDLFTGAAVLGAHVWDERCLHRVVGSWAVEARVEDLVVVLDRIAMHHAWRAELLFERLPQLRELPVERIVTCTGDGIAADWQRSWGSATDDQRCDAWVVAAEQRVARYREHLARTTVVGDAPLRRSMPIVIDSLLEDLDALVAARGR
ncbi:MAG: hypothetical protein JST64_00560 [Actinobacteria bacterium]|nr:hypothetical protein [Actinomycetota bacterium]